ncbi:MAG TPA: 2-hydroxychromene-2-carboxylate isomerase [Burkholderiales bacterium]|nr:2-hydroxychromene-2-carboxylate isomerase [Burkholderiales bacterium]
MASPIDFYFDFSSPYGYFASQKIDAIASKHGRDVKWRPFLLGVAFKTTGGTPLPSIPVKGPYHLRDMLRTAKYLGVTFRHPSVFPIASVSACRAFYWMNAKDPRRAKELAKALYGAYFREDVDISSADNVVSVAARSGLSADEVRAGIGDQATKDLTKIEVDKAIAIGAFGSPYIVVDGEPFWGSDRLEQIDKWLATGGW